LVRARRDRGRAGSPAADADERAVAREVIRESVRITAPAGGEPEGFQPGGQTGRRGVVDLDSCGRLRGRVGAPEVPARKVPAEELRGPRLFGRDATGA